MKRIGLLLALAILLLSAGAASAISYTDDFNTLNVKFWSVTVSGGGKAEVQNGQLYLSGVSNTKASAEVDSVPIQVGEGTIIEFTLKTDFQGAAASGGSSREWGLKINGTKIAVFKANEKGFRLLTPVQNLTLNKTIAQQFVEYEFVLNSTSVTVYENGNKIFTIPKAYPTIQVYFKVNTWSNPSSPHNAQIWVDNFSVVGKARVTFRVSDALTGKALSNVTLTVDGKQYKISDGSVVSLYTGLHNITLSLPNYREYSGQINVTGDSTLSFQLYPQTAVFYIEDFPPVITVYKNEYYKLTFTISPIDGSRTYNTYMSVTGLNVSKVEKDGSTVSPSGGKYYLGDISGPTRVSITFRATKLGEYGFFITFESHDILNQHTYKEVKNGVYKVEALPFLVQMPREWLLGKNTVKISDNSGNNYLLTVLMTDSSGKTVYLNSFKFSAYDTKSFSVDIKHVGRYELQLTFNGHTAVYDITVNPSIILLTKEVNVTKGGEGSVELEFKNTGDDVQYYTIELSGGFLPKPVNDSVAIAPHTVKDVSVSFAVPEDLLYDAYELNVSVMQGNVTVFSDKVAVSISDSEFSLFGGVSGSETIYYGLAALAGLGLFIAILRRR